MGTEKITHKLEALYKGDIEELEEYLDYHGCHNLLYSVNIDGTYMLWCQLTDDLKLMLKLKFNVAEIFNNCDFNKKF